MFVDTGLAATTTYYYRVRAVNGAGASGFSNVANAQTQSGPPSAPTGLSATANSSSQITIGWTDTCTNETGFEIERSISNLPFVALATTAAGATSFVDTGLSPATTYVYRVRAVNAAGTSAFSNEASARTLPGTPPPPAPRNLTATAVSASQINLAWADDATDEDGFEIERSADGTTFAVIGSAPANATVFS